MTRSKRQQRRNRLETARTARAFEDVCWNLLRAQTALKAQRIYEARTGLPAWTCRPILADGFDEVTDAGDRRLLKAVRDA